MNDSYSCFVISNKPHTFPAIQNSTKPIPLKFFDGTDFPSFSKLVNTCVESATTENVIIMSDKVLPIETHVQKTLELLEKGYAFVGLYRFAFFGVKKELFRKIGPLDERFIGGGYEDDDYYIRLKEANIGVYLSEEVPYKKSNSSWRRSLSKLHFINKWILNFNPSIKLPNHKIKRMLDEENYDYNWGDSNPTTFLTWKESKLLTSKARKYTTPEITK